MTAETVTVNTVRGQYIGGVVEGEPVPAMSRSAAGRPTPRPSWR
jgi:glucose-6-phosphate 1-dehydrogenase